MREYNEESPLLNDALRSQASKDLEASTVEINASPLPSEDGQVSETPTSPPNDSKPDRRTYIVLGMLMLSVFVSSLDNSLVIVTSGTIASEFDSLRNADLLLTSYLVAVSATQPIYGKLSDIYGRKTVLLVAYTIFTVGCAICGLGMTMWQVVAGRIIAGFGGGGMIALVLVLIADLLPVRQVATWRAYFNVFSATGRCVGGPVGGVLADTIGWRWSFLIQCPIVAVVATLVVWQLPTPPSDESPDHVSKSKAKKFSRIDIPGSILLFCTIASLLLVLELGGKKLPMGSPIVIGLICATVALAVSFVLVEAYTKREPVFPLRLAVNRDIATAYGAAGLQLAAEFGVTSTVPLYFQVTQNAKAAVAGARLLPGLVAYAFGGLLAGGLIAKTGRYKWLGIAGPTISCIGFMLLFTQWRGHTNNLGAFYIVPGDFGSGISQSTAFIALSAAIDKADTAVAMTGYSVCQQLGVTIGASTTAAILQRRLATLLEKQLGKGLETSLVIKRVVSDIGYIKSLTGVIKSTVVNAYVGGLSYTYLYSFSLAACALIAAIFVKERKL